ncbi:MAG TPA: hypothetical protein VFA81_03125 [Burkholderiales bacterium]|nr:hypothetical protein [Burkholderiales bacterium]
MPIISRAILVTVAFALWSFSLSARTAEDDVAWIADKNGCKVANPYPRPGETITWSGECKGGFAHGNGVLQWYLNGKPDDRYEGTMEQGWAEGHGVLRKGDGGTYDGNWKHSMQEGLGRYDAPDGSVYDGEWKNGKPNGSGQFRTPDGRMFMGQWKDGVFEGDEEPEDDEDSDPNRT